MYFTSIFSAFNNDIYKSYLKKKLHGNGYDTFYHIEEIVCFLHLGEIKTEYLKEYIYYSLDVQI